MTSRGNHGNDCLLSQIFLLFLLVAIRIPNFKFLVYPILEILPAGYEPAPSLEIFKKSPALVGLKKIHYSLLTVYKLFQVICP